MLLWFLLLSAISLARGTTLPAMQVTVTNAAGKVLYKGMTNTSGAFETSNLDAGNYVVEFDSKAKIAKGTKFALSATAGKYNVNADSVAGEKLVDPGVAMRINLAGKEKITGQVAPAGSLGKQTAAATQGNAKSKYTGPVKIINGKRYIWITPYTGSVGGGHWAEEGSPEAMQAQGGPIQGSTPSAPHTSSMSGRY